MHADPFGHHACWRLPGWRWLHPARRCWATVILAALLLVLVGSGPGVARAADAAVRVPLQPGLVLGMNVRMQGVSLPDYVAYFRIAQVQPQQLVIEGFRQAADAGAPAGKRYFRFSRIVRGEDLRTAYRISPQYITDDPSMFPGYTANEASAQLLADLKGGKPTRFVLAMTPVSGAAGSKVLDMVSGALKDVPNLGGAFAGFSSEFTRKYYRGELQRVEATDVPVPVLLDGAVVALPAVHAHGMLKAADDGGAADFWILDDPTNALLLRWSFQGRTLEIVHIDVPPPATAPAAGLTKALSGKGVGGGDCHVALQGIYFDSGSADLLPLSDAALSGVAAVIKGHPDWILTVEGHTDNIGTPASNQDLSQRRAQSVRDALAKRYAVPANRLQARGFGAGRPVDSNATAVGRAHNRRVELSRACH